MELTCKANGQFKIQLNRGGAEIASAPLQDNIFTDGFYGLASLTDGVVVHVGSSSVAPTKSDTGVISYLGKTNSSVFYGWTTESSSVENGNLLIRQSIALTANIGAIVGNASEISLVLGTTAVTRALIKDSGGNPTTIPIGAEDQFVITYYVNWTIPIDQPSYVIQAEINNVVTPVTVKPWLVNLANWRGSYLFPLYGRSSYLKGGVNNYTVDTALGTVSITGSAPTLLGNYAATLSHKSALSNTTNGIVLLQEMNFSLTEGNMTFNNLAYGGSSPTSLTDIFCVLQLDTSITKVDTEVMALKLQIRFKGD